LSKKQKPHRPVPLSPAELAERAERARREGRFQQALELAKQLYKADPNPARLELLKDVYLGRARQLRGQGQTRDSATVLDAAAHLDGQNLSWLQQLAAEMGRCGEPARALALLGRIPQAEQNGAVLGALVDAALVQEGAARALLAPALQNEIALIQQAFQQVEAGQDDAARATLQAIGLKSPCLEWKLLLRGLQAYYQKDDARALENWARLDPQRVPSRLAAPFRYHLDPAFRAAQPLPAQTTLAQQYDRLQGSGLLPQLRQLRTTLANPQGLAAAFRQVEAMLPALRQEAPQTLHRLATVFYWAILQTGPDDIIRYQRVFGRPAEDPNFNRLNALAYEKAPPSGLTQAHHHWQQYEKDIAAHPEVFPPGQAVRARALIWKHLGDNAGNIPDDKQRKQLPSFLRDLPGLPRPLDPPPEKCYQTCLELAPDLREAHQALFRHYLLADRPAQAEKVARTLLERFPDDVATLQSLATLRADRDDPAEALQLYLQALAHNPLDRRLRERVGTAHMLTARPLALAKRFDEARTHYQAALSFASSGNTYSVQCRWAACEFKAGNDARAEELLEQARAGTAPVVVSFILLSETARLKLPPAFKKRFDKEFAAGLKEEPTAASLLGLADYAHGLQHPSSSYHGLKTHTKKVLDFVARGLHTPMSERELVELCRDLVDLDKIRMTRSFLDRAERQYPRNPFFPYLRALTYLQRDSEAPPGFQVGRLLERAQELARAVPKDDEVQAMLDDIQVRLVKLAIFNPFGRGFSMLEDIFGGMPFYEEDDDDDDW
jgi:tetratricopeptide (TPR) repeat protein